MKLWVAVDGSEPALEATPHALRLHAAGPKAGFVLAPVQEATFPHELPGSVSQAVLQAATMPVTVVGQVDAESPV